MNSMKSKHKTQQPIRNSSVFLFIIFFLLVLTGLVNIVIFHKLHTNDVRPFLRWTFKQMHIDKSTFESNSEQNVTLPEKHNLISQENENGENNSKHHPIAGLSCKDHGGPDDESASEMIFWSDIPSDSKYTSPFYDPEKYITFEPDAGGWNNIRMAYETILVLAHATGRTLVLPPEQKMYLLGKGGKHHKKDFSFNDFFHLDSISLEHQGLNIITTEEFLKRKGITGELKDRKTGQILTPPDNKTNWDGDDVRQLFQYLRKVGKYPDGWNPMECIAAIPSSKDPKAVDELQTMFDDILAGKYGEIPNPEKDFIDDPVPVDAEPVYRLRELLSGRNKICIYDKELQDEQVLHFKVDHSEKARMLTHFYAFVFFQDWKQDLWSKRFVRDHIRYIDDIVCAAARIVKAVRERARNRSPSNVKGEYDSFHVRRGDFQYKKVKVGADVLYEQSKDQLQEGATLYIATDERDKEFFNLLKQKYDVTFLDDYMHLIQGVNPNYYGMLDQLVAYKGRVFFGTWFSTLSGYINRMRGYYSVKNHLDGYERGTLQSYYFVPSDKKLTMTKYMAVKKPLYMREFPVSWRDIDKSVNQL